jgi:hypothetical protein
MRRSLFFALVVLAAACLSQSTVAAREPETVTISGSFILVRNESKLMPRGTPCTPTHKKPPLEVKMPVVVTDYSMTRLASAPLGPGHVLDHRHPKAAMSRDCAFVFRISSVPLTDNYIVSVEQYMGFAADQHSLAAQHWHVNVLT